MSPPYRIGDDGALTSFAYPPALLKRYVLLFKMHGLGLSEERRQVFRPG